MGQGDRSQPDRCFLHGSGRRPAHVGAGWRRDSANRVDQWHHGIPLLCRLQCYEGRCDRVDALDGFGVGAQDSCLRGRPRIRPTPMQRAEYTDEMLEEVNHKIPLRRHAKPEEIAALFAFLASDDAAYMTGHVYTIDGAETAGSLAGR